MAKILSDLFDVIDLNLMAIILFYGVPINLLEHIRPLGVPRCREGLSEVIASVIFFFSVRNRADKRKADWVECTHLFTLLYNFL